ncbi:MAG: beta-galactosidase, partial [Planctomycetota bacterium]
MGNETGKSVGYVTEMKLSMSGRISFPCLVLIAVVMCVLAGIAGAEEKNADRKRLVFVGSPYMREKLIKPLVKNYIANSSLSDEDVKLSLGGPRDWLPPGTSEVSWGNADFMLTSRLDWKWRMEDEANITEDERNKLTFYPVAREVVKRDGKVIGGVLYGLMGKKDVSQQGQKFLDYLDTDEAHKVIEKQYRFVPPSKKVPTYEAPSHVDAKLWNDTVRPLMVHGVDVHPEAYRTTMIAELAKIRMEGYNEVMVGGQSDAMMAWAEENGMMISGKPKLTKEDLEGKTRAEAMAEKTQEFPNLRAVFLGNEDRVGKIMAWVASGEYQVHHTNKPIEEQKQEKWEGIIAKFPDWLKEKHGSLEALNRAWGTDFSSWEEVSFPDEKLEELADIAPLKNKTYLRHIRFGEPSRYYYMRDYPDLLDGYRYIRKVWADEYDEEVGGFKSKVRKDFLYATKTGADPYVQRAVKSFNAASWDHTMAKFPPQELQILVDTVQTGAGRSVWNSEDHLYNKEHDYGDTPERIRYVLLRNYLLGQFQSTEYDRIGTSGKEIEKTHRWAVRARNQIRRNEDVFRAFLESRAAAGITVLVTEGNRGWNTFPDSPTRPEMGGAVRAYAYVGALGRPWKYVLDRDVSAEHVGDVLIIDSAWLTNATLDRIVNLPEDRRIIVVGDIPAENEYGQALPDDKVQEFRDRLTQVESWRELSGV